MNNRQLDGILTALVLDLLTRGSSGDTNNRANCWRARKILKEDAAAVAAPESR
jgi:hypothetical protein